MGRGEPGDWQAVHLGGDPEAAASPKAEKRLGVPDLSSPKVIRYYVDRARALKRAGVKAVWYDLFFQMP